MKLAARLALALAATTAPLSAAQIYQPVVKVGDVLPTGETITTFSEPFADRAGPGFAVAALTFIAPFTQERRVLHFDGTGSPPTVVDDLGLSFNGDHRIRITDCAQGRVAYHLEDNTGQRPNGFYVDGTLVIAEIERLPTIALAATRTGALRLATNGDVIWIGVAASVGNPSVDVAVNMTTGAVIHQAGDPLVGAPGNSDSMPFLLRPNDDSQWMATSPDGARLLHFGGDDSGGSLLMLDRVPLMMEDTPIRDGEPLGPVAASLLGVTGGSIDLDGTDTRLHPSSVDDDGRWHAFIRVTGVGHVSCLTGRLIRGFTGIERCLGLGPLGDPVAGIRAEFDSGVLVTRGQLMSDSHLWAMLLDLDEDGDGVPDGPFPLVIARDQKDEAIFDGNGVPYLISETPFQNQGRIGRVLIDVPGERTCDGTANATGVPAQLSCHGSRFVSSNQVQLRALELPAGAAVLPIVSRTPGASPNPGGGLGQLCLGGAIGRMNGSIFFAPSSGLSSVALDLTALPTPTGPTAAQPGETWHFQLWYRDVSQGMPTSNLSSALAIRFQ